MPIDPRIILGVNPVRIQQQDPLEQYGKSLTLKNLMGAGDLQNLQLQTAKRGIEDENAVRSAYTESGGDAVRLRTLLGERGQYKAIQGLDKFEMEKLEKQSTIDKNKAQGGKAGQETIGKALENNRALLDGVRDPQSAAQWVAASYQDPLLSPLFSRMGPVESAVASIPKEPKQFQEWLFKNREGIAKAAANQRALESQAETTRHNQKMESNAAGNLNLSRERMNFERGAGRAPAGYRAKPDGTLEFIPGGPADPSAAANKAALGIPGEDERKAAGWLAQATNAYNNMASVMTKTPGAEGPGGFEAALSTVPLVGDTMARTVRSGARDSFVQAASSFSEAALRAATGAGVNMQEAQQKIDELTPKFLDNADTRKQKLDSLKVYLDSIRARAGRAVQSTPIPPLTTMPDVKGAKPSAKIGGVLTQNPDGSFNYGAP